MKRIFIAIKIEPESGMLNMISTFKSLLIEDNIKWTNLENIHITLAFLGDTDDSLIWGIGRMLKEKCEKYGPFELIIKGSGIFKSLSDPRIIWIGLEPSEELKRLNGTVIDGLAGIGIKIEERPFKPHLTIGRIKYLKPGNDLKELIEKYREKEFQRMSVNDLILYESILLPTGPVYKILEKIIL
jgi:2'-5' RNA ligase